ncbi:sensor histidine kinase [Xanthocytophaga flava]|uniref:sensor histidine kinase n=1 Tax=Xanthocytophaga flava TaxID=3048013 RepID=UPI0028D1CCB8|nr:HAMP domain-containing sensor histidine kinase [Xanthocytophaga flavus]MDJ1473747.1 HAMP domain-containing sensor histidine kinase [Xanthocytophaga flavus]
MNRRTFRLIIILATLSVFGIVVVQVFWFRQAFNVREVEFDRTAREALAKVAHSILRYNQHTVSSNVSIKKASSNYYVVMVNDVIDEELLKTLLRNELEKRDIRIDFQYIIYDCANNEAVFGNYFVFGKEDIHPTANQIFPKIAGDNYYFGIRFVNKDLALVGEMRFWIFSSAVLLIVISFFAYTSFVVLRQRRLSEIQQDFINNMTHEFKTPLSTISISSEVLKNPKITQSPERLLSYATIIGQEANRLKGQVERVLQMASLENEEIKLKKETIDLHQLITQAAEPFQLSLTEKGGTLQLHLDATRNQISGDKLHITNVLYNLLDNAIKYNHKVPEILITTQNEKDQISFTVKDNGIGISQEHIKRIFDRFYRVPTGNVHDVKGFGLGLNYVRLIVKAHAGTIKVTSEPDQGSSFTIWLPVTSEKLA